MPGQIMVYSMANCLQISTLQTFIELQNHVKSVLVLLFEKEPTGAKLINDELHKLVIDLEAFGLRYSNSPLAGNDNGVDEQARRSLHAEVIKAPGSFETHNDANVLSLSSDRPSQSNRDHRFEPIIEDIIDEILRESSPCDIGSLHTPSATRNPRSISDDEGPAEETERDKMETIESEVTESEVDEIEGQKITKKDQVHGVVGRLQEQDKSIDMPKIRKKKIVKKTTKCTSLKRDKAATLDVATLDMPTASRRGTKRKSSNSLLGQKAKDTSPNQIASASAKDLALVPGYRIQPTDVCRIFVDRGMSKDTHAIRLLTRLFFSIASPDAFDQLRAACNTTRHNRDHKLCQNPSIFQTLLVLDTLDITASTASILQRFHLSRLVVHRNDRERHHKSQGRVTRSERSQEGFGRASSLALVDLMGEAYPDLKQPQKLPEHLIPAPDLDDLYQRKLKSLKNKLSRGRNWQLMQDRFSAGILALVPTDGEYFIHNHE
jgi:hypothetical protein